MTKKWLLTSAIGVLAVWGSGCEGAGIYAGDEDLQLDSPRYDAELGTEQPIAFPHDVHAGDFQIECMYCHFSAERSVSAGIPPVATCMGCHTVIRGRENPEEIARLAEFWESREAIPWVRVYKVSDHVRFPHMRHIAANVDCATCHGNVREIGVIREVNQDLTMGWCVSCHVENSASIDCAVCHY